MEDAWRFNQDLLKILRMEVLQRLRMLIRFFHVAIIRQKSFVSNNATVITFGIFKDNSYRFFYRFNCIPDFLIDFIRQQIQHGLSFPIICKKKKRILNEQLLLFHTVNVILAQCSFYDWSWPPLLSLAPARWLCTFGIDFVVAKELD